MNQGLIPTGECWCGCGEQTSIGAFFLQGHDKFAEGAVIAIEFGGVPEFIRDQAYGPGETTSVRHTNAGSGRRNRLLMSPATRWKVGEADWDWAKAAVKRRLVASPRVSSTLSCSELVDEVGYFFGPDSHALAETLGEPNAEEDLYKRQPLLLAAV